MIAAPAVNCEPISASPPVAPNATGSCFHTMVMPMAASMPLMTADGTSALNRPVFSRPNSTCKPPATIVAVRNGASPPSCCISTITIDASPAAGPLTDNGERLTSANCPGNTFLTLDQNGELYPMLYKPGKSRELNPPIRFRRSSQSLP